MRKKLLLLVLVVVVLPIGYRIVWFYKFGKILQPESIYAATVSDIANRAHDDLYFLQINGQDPSPSLLRLLELPRLQRKVFIVRKASEGKRFSHVHSLDQTVDLRTGQTGTVIKLQGIKWQQAIAEFGPPPSKYPAAIVSLKDRGPAASNLCLGEFIQMIYVDGHWKLYSTNAICAN